MTPAQLAQIEEAIATAFIRSNVLTMEQARSHAGLAMDHVRKALKTRQEVG